MSRSPPLIELCFPISVKQFHEIDKAVRRAGYKTAIEWSENIKMPTNADDFASEAIYVICNSGMANRIALPIFEDCMRALRSGQSCKTVFGHPGKSDAIDYIWKKRRSLYRKLLKAVDLIAFCETLPWIGPITSKHLAKNLGADVAKPDVHLNRLAEPEGVTAQELCERLARGSGQPSLHGNQFLWRACADGIIYSR